MRDPGLLVGSLIAAEQRRHKGDWTLAVLYRNDGENAARLASMMRGRVTWGRGWRTAPAQRTDSIRGTVPRHP